MSESSERRRARLREQLRARGENLPAELARLGNAVWGESADAISHAECRANLPRLVQAEAADKPVAKLFPAVKHHLDYCESCSAIYLEMLELAVADRANELTPPLTVPTPNLSFWGQAPTLGKRALIQAWARNLLSAFSPKHLPELSVIADTFFQQAESLHGEIFLKASPGAALGFSGGEITPALETLALAYATAQRLGAGLSAERIQAWSQTNSLPSELETRIRAAALDIGLDSKTALTLAAEFANQLAEDPPALQALVSAD